MVTITTSNPGELLFENYLQARGYEILDYEPGLGTRKRPDYLIRAADRQVVVEVEAFNTPPLDPQVMRSGFIRPPGLSTVREAIKAAAEQLKGIFGYPLVVVLANPHHCPVPLTPSGVLAAMYGDPQFEFCDEDEHRWRTGRDGRLRVDEPDGTHRGYHPYVSAVAVLRDSHTEDALTVKLLSDHPGMNPILACLEGARLAQEQDPDTKAVSLDVFTTVSHDACPLPPEVFAGPLDTRWGPLSPGRYGRLTPPALPGP
jgi:hypothetical protein